MTDEFPEPHMDPVARAMVEDDIVRLQASAPGDNDRSAVELAAIISDEEIVRVHGHANFGAMAPREVVNDGVRKIAVGYHCGHTQFTILREHGLITKPRGMSYDCNLTKKGKRYFRTLSRPPVPMDAAACRAAREYLAYADEGLNRVDPWIGVGHLRNILAAIPAPRAEAPEGQAYG